MLKREKERRILCVKVRREKGGAFDEQKGLEKDICHAGKSV